jgi:HPt (histidine-containing phosphotransfer) domain-containing protein
MLQTVAGDRDLLREVAEAFLEEAPRLLDELRTAVAADDAEGLQRAAHTLKSSLRYLGAAELFEQAFLLETCGREGRAPEADFVRHFIARVEKMFVDLPRLVGITA